MSQYLLIQNKEEAPIEAYTSLGYSTACDEANSMGKFGTGSKQAITLLMREGLEVTVYAGNTRLRFSTPSDEPNSKVLCQRNSRRARETGWVLRFGSDDWTSVDMAIREFVSNAIDRHENREKGSFRAALASGDLKVSLVDANERRAKAGFTRVYVEVNDEVRRYFANLGEKFLHFSDNPDRVDETLLPKTAPGPAKIFRMGALVCEMNSVEGDSLFDYNFNSSQIKIDEARNSNIYVAKAACAKLLRGADRRSLTVFFKSLANNETTFESKLDPDYILDTWVTPTPDQIAEWSGAWKAVFGEAILVTNEYTQKCVEGKGKKTQRISSEPATIRVMERLGIPSGDSVLSEREIEGLVSLPATEHALKALNYAWNIVSKSTRTEKTKPGVLCYDEKLNADDSRFGFHDNKGIHLRHDICTQESEQLHKETLRHVIGFVANGYDEAREMTLEIILHLAEEAVLIPLRQV